MPKSPSQNPSRTSARPQSDWANPLARLATLADQIYAAGDPQGAVSVIRAVYAIGDLRQRPGGEQPAVRRAAGRAAALAT